MNARVIHVMLNDPNEPPPPKRYRLKTSLRACLRQIRRLEWRGNDVMECEFCDGEKLCAEWFEDIEMAICEDCARSEHAAAWRDLCPIPGVVPVFEVLP